MKTIELLAPAGSFEKAKIAFCMEQMQYIVEHHHCHLEQEQICKIMI